MNKTILSWSSPDTIAPVSTDPVACVDWPGPIQDAVRRWAAEPGAKRVALACPDGSLTYAQLDRFGDALAHHLTRAAPCAGRVVAILAERRAQIAPALLAILRAGGQFTVIDLAYPAGRILRMLNVADPALILQIGANPGPAHPCPRLVLPGLDDPALWDLMIEGAPPTPIDADPGPDDPAALTFTSGSTGTPMAVQGRHSGLTAFLPWLTDSFGIGPDDTISLLSGLSHDPLQRDVFTAWWAGARLAVPPPDVFDLPGAMGRWMAEAGVSVANLTPSMLRLLTMGGAGPDGLSALRHVFLVGEAVRAADVLALRAIAPAAAVINLYGATETQRALVHHRIAPSDTPVDPIPLGRACPGMEVMVLDADQRPVARGETGAIWIKSRHLALGYLGDLAATTRAFVTDADGVPRYATGDRGYIRADGALIFAGRRDRQVNVRGFRVELGDVESAAEQIAGVRQARALWQADRGLILLFVVLDEAAVAAREVAKTLSQHVPGYMRPARVSALPALPVTPNGKIDDAALLDRAHPCRA